MHSNAVIFRIPDWLQAQRPDTPTPDAAARMAWVIELSRRNVDLGTGGPFAAALFNMETHAPVATGVNLVTSSGLSIAHAEIVAISMAQQTLGTFDLSRAGRFELVSSCEPCAMCFGALPWSGIRALTCGARDRDAREIGFDEGPRHPQWIDELERRGIAVQTELCREAARGVLQRYAAAEGTIYNGGRGQ
ncbi:MAG TPA: nucleoside deaminase [Mariprofundaceae bacterium]|nr:nucleoside deaminase [Mariprofundaceae bacterium]